MRLKTETPMPELRSCGLRSGKQRLSASFIWPFALLLMLTIFIKCCGEPGSDPVIYRDVLPYHVPVVSEERGIEV